MYGFINRALENLIVRKYGGRSVWNRIRDIVGIRPEERQELQERQIYEDSYTFHLLRKASEICGVSESELLEGFGEQFFIWCREFGYDRTLQALGATVRDFLCNLDALHDHLATSMFPAMKAPSFRCSDGPNGDIYLHYYSARRGLQHIVIGIVKTVCRQLHNTVVRMEIVEEVDDTHDHVVFAIQELGPVSSKRGATSVDQHCQHYFQPDLSYIEKLCWSSVPVVQFCQIFPFHVVFDDQLQIRQMGVSLFRMVATSVVDVQTVTLTDLFIVERPQGMTLSFSEIKAHTNMVFVLRGKGSLPTEALRVKGQMTHLNDDNDSAGKMLFLCSPRIGDLSDLCGRRLYLSDLPLHDATRDMLLLDDTRANQHCEIVKLEEMNTKLNVAHQDLANAHQDLAKEKDLTDKLLYSMFPMHVASQLKQKKAVAAETFPSVTILFSDVVGFTSICGSCHPSRVVRMLDGLYKEFDAVTRENKLYKVETIGDAYMVVGGLTSRTGHDSHEEVVCNQALDMMAVVSKVRNPSHLRDHIHIRVGIHSGEVMAGVVGHLMPRYCLFGDAVNVASRTESTGVADKIQVTEATHKGLETKSQFVFDEPRVVEMKNVGEAMVCYFLRENKERHYRILELRRRRPSVQVPETSEAQSSVGNVKCSPLIADSGIASQDTRNRKENVVEETFETTEDQAPTEATRANRRDCCPRPTKKCGKSTVLLFVALLIAAIAVAIHILSSYS